MAEQSNGARTGGNGPLAGVRVFDMTTAAAGPWGPLVLAWLGATVIKIDPPGDPWTGDLAVRVPPNMRGIGTLWLTCNTFKRSVMLDFKNPEHVRLGRRIAATCDLYVENMRPGVAARLGFGYEQLRELNPDIAYISVTGYGQVGPMAREACTDPLAQAFSGWTSVQGAEGSTGESYRHYAHIDLTTASYSALASLLLLYRRRRQGRGGRINISMLRAGLANQTTRLAEYFATGRQPAPLGSASARTAPNQAFRTLDGRWLTVAVEREEQWPRFCAAIERPDLRDAYPTNAVRVERRTELATTLVDWFATKPIRWWDLRLTRHDVPHGRTLSFDDLLSHPQVTANDMLVQSDTPYGPLWTGALPVRFENHRRAAATNTTPGGHTDEVLATLPVAPEAAAVGAGTGGRA